MTPIERERATTSITTVSNATTIICQVVKEIAGNDISSTIEGSRLSTELIANIAQNRILSEVKRA